MGTAGWRDMPEEEELKLMLEFRDHIEKWDSDYRLAKDDGIVWVACGGNGKAVKVKKPRHKCGECGKSHVIKT